MAEETKEVTTTDVEQTAGGVTDTEQETKESASELQPTKTVPLSSASPAELREQAAEELNQKAAVMGYDQQIAALQAAAARYAPETEEQRKKREKKEMDSDEALMKDLGFFIQNGGYCTYNKEAIAHIIRRENWNDGAISLWSRCSISSMEKMLSAFSVLKMKEVQ